MQIYLRSHVPPVATAICRVVGTSFCIVMAGAALLGLGFSVYAHWIAMNGVVFFQTPLFWRLIYGVLAFGVVEVILNYVNGALGLHGCWSEEWQRTFLNKFPRAIRWLYYFVAGYCFVSY